MGFLQADKLAAAQVAFNTVFDRAFDELKKLDSGWERLATTVQMTAKTEEFDWMGDVPAFTEWLGERKIGRLRAENYRVTVKKWANGLEVDEDDLEDDRLGLYEPKIRQLAAKARVHKINLLVDFLANGFATTKYGAGYDGKAFFATDHIPGGAGSGAAAVSNKLTATLDDAGALDSAIQKMLEMTDEQGEPLGMNPTTLIVGPSNRAEARKQVLAQINANGATNTNYQVVDVLVSPKLVGSHASKWFLLDLSKPLGPLIWAERRPVRFRSVGPAMGGQESMESFMKGKLYFGCDARYNAAYGLWECAVGSDGTT